MFQSYEHFLKNIEEPVEEDVYTEELKPIFFNRNLPTYNRTEEFDIEVKAFRDDINSSKYAQQRVVAAAKSPCEKDTENAVLKFLDQIDIYPRTVEAFCESKTAFDIFNRGSLYEMENYIKEKQEKTQRLLEEERERNSKKYSRDMNLAFFGPPFLLAFLPVILFVLCLLTCARTGCGGCWFCDFCISEFMFFWLFSIIFTGPIALLIMVSRTNAVHRKYGEEPDKLTNAVLLASAIRCAFSNIKQTKKSVKNLLDQNGKTEV